MPERVQERPPERNSPLVAILETDLPPHLKLTLVAMVSFGPRISPSHKRIAGRTSVSPRAVRDSIADLKKLGIIVPVGHVTRGPGLPTVEYRLVLEKLPAADDTVSAPNCGSPLPQFKPELRKPTAA